MTANTDNEALHQISYISIEAMPYSYMDLEAMLASFRKHNEAHGITGLLLHRNKGFFQVFEGPKSQVLTLWENIQNDKRHVLVTELNNRKVEQRLCQQWRMGFEDLEDQLGPAPQGFVNINDVEQCIATIKDPQMAGVVTRFIANL